MRVPWARLKQTADARVAFQPSLRDGGDCCSTPGVETPGYYQASLRDAAWTETCRASLGRAGGGARLYIGSSCR